MDASNNQCRREQIAAYLDGELDASAGTLFEKHMRGCPSCSAELTAQRLFLCELNATLTLTPDPPVPRNFAQIVAARAESDMSGIRESDEHKRALRFSLILAFASFALLGAAAGKAALFSGKTVVNQIFGIVGLLWTALYDAAVGLTIIWRVISGGVISESPFAGLAVLLLALAVVLLSLLIASYHRNHELRLFE